MGGKDDPSSSQNAKDIDNAFQDELNKLNAEEKEEAYRALKQIKQQKMTQNKQKETKPKSQPTPSQPAKKSKQVIVPSPNVLAKAQREFRESFKPGKEHKMNGDDPPEYFPPPTTKDQVFNLETYKYIDDAVKTCPLSISTGPIEPLVEYLTEKATNDIGKVRAFFVWIASQQCERNKEDCCKKDPSQGDNMHKKAIMAGEVSQVSYNKLFKDMCDKCNIPCDIIYGGAKGYENEDEDCFDLNSHHWCIVFVDGAFRFVDQIFGSEYMARDLLAWDVVKSNVDLTGSASHTDNEKMHYIGEEHFLTDPEQFIYKHLPNAENDFGAEKSQLLARPITHDEFNEMGVISKCFWDWEIEDISEVRTKILVDEKSDGTFMVSFKPKRGREMTLSYALLKLADSGHQPMVHCYQDADTNDVVRIENKAGRKQIKVYFKNIGDYKLQILVKDQDSTTLRELVKYRLDVDAPYFKEIANPVLATGLQEIGPGAAWHAVHITTDFEGGIIQAKPDGTATITFKCPNNVAMNFHLKKNDDDKEKDGIDECLLMENAKESVNLHVKLKEAGTFLLKAFTGLKDAKALQHTCNFLIESEYKCIGPFFPGKHLFPTVGAVGSGIDFLMPKNGMSYIKLDPENDKSKRNDVKVTKNEYDISMEILQEDTQYLFKMENIDCLSDTSDYNLDQYVRHEIDSDKSPQILKIFLHIKKRGLHFLRVFIKPKTEEKQFTLAWKFLLQAEMPTHDFVEFPTPLKDWKPCGVKLREPLSGKLAQGATVKFTVDWPGANRVKVMKCGENKTSALTKDKDSDRFQGTINTLLEQNDMVLYAEMKGTGNEVHQFCKYSVVDANQLGERQIQYELEVAQIEEQVKPELEVAKAKAQNEAACKKTKTRENEEQRKAKFEANKETYRAEVKETRIKNKENSFKQRLANHKLTKAKLQKIGERAETDANVHKATIPFLLLMGYSEDETEDPSNVKQRIFNEHLDEITEEMNNCLPKHQNDEIMMRARELTRQVNVNELYATLPEGSHLLDWVKDMTDEADKSKAPANKERQKQILQEMREERGLRRYEN